MINKSHIQKIENNYNENIFFTLANRSVSASTSFQLAKVNPFRNKVGTFPLSECFCLHQPLSLAPKQGEICYLWTQKVSRYFLFMDWQDLRVGTQWQKVQLEVMRRGHGGVESSVASREWPGEAVRWQVSSGVKASSGILGDCQFKFDSPGFQLILWGIYTPTKTFFFVCKSTSTDFHFQQELPGT